MAIDNFFIYFICDGFGIFVDHLILFLGKPEYIIYSQVYLSMQSKKFVNNPEAAIFNIRKVNKKAIGLGKNLGDQVYYTPEADHEKDITFQNYSSLFHSEVIDQRK